MTGSPPAQVLLEVCVDEVEAGLAAARGGAGRIELCSRLDLEGLTPDSADLERLLAEVEVPVFAMVRPRAGDFVLGPGELDAMQRDLERVARLGAQGVVLGALDRGGRVDAAAVERLRQLAGDLPLTFHRAFDQVSEPLEALETLVELGVERLLTTGGPPTAWEGRERLRQLTRAAGGRLVLMPGGGVRQDHVHALLEHCGAREVHSSVVLRL